MYILSVSADDDHFKPGRKYKVIDKEGNFLTVIDESGYEFHVSSKCVPIKDGRLKIISKKGNLSLF